MRRLPSGTVTLLFTDIEGSTRLLDGLGHDAFNALLVEHRRILRQAFGAHGGIELRTEGDSFFAAFEHAAEAVAAAAEVQTELKGLPVRVRIGIHTGQPMRVEHEDGYVGIDVHRGARVAAAAHGGQVLLSEATRELLDSSVKVRDLGLHRLKDLAEPIHVFQLELAGVAGDFPPLRSLDSRRTNIPAAASTLVGRSRELAELADLLARPDLRLLTLTGPGGTGKTRLAAAVAAARLQHEPDGVWFVDLSALQAPELVLPAIAREVAGKEDVEGVFTGRRLLLVLDNFEQVLDAAMGVAALLSDEPGVRAIVTSREPLRLQAEREYAVDPLAETEAVELFVRQARALRPEFEADASVSAICRRLDCLPLAVQLAAARTRVLDPPAILARLEQRLSLLTHGPRDLPVRQQTLRATIAWSYDLLAEPEQQAFAAVGVFAGGFTVDAADTVAGVGVDELEALVERSLLRRGERLSLLETIREFAVERLEEQGAEDVRLRHARFYTDLLEDAGPELDGPNQPRLLRELELEHDNVRAALSWTLAVGDSDLALRLVAAAGRFWLLHDHVEEGGRWLERALAAGGRQDLRVHALRHAGAFAYRTHDLARAAACFAESAALARDLGDRYSLARALGNLGLVRLESGDPEAAVELFEENRLLAREHGWHASIASATHNLGMAAIARDDPAAARAYFEQALELFGSEGDTWSRANSLASLGRALLRLDDVDAAARAVGEALELAREVDESMITAAALELAAEIANRRGRAETAALLLGTASGVWERGQADREVQWEAYVQTVAARVQGALEPGEWERAVASGRALDLESATAVALDALEALEADAAVPSPGAQ